MAGRPRDSHCVRLRASAEEVKREFDAYVAEVNHCEGASQCTLAAAGCPLGCVVAVRADAQPGL